MTLFAPAGVGLCVLGLNVVERAPGRIWSGITETWFATPRGWPLIAVATANDDGAAEIDASVTQGDTRVAREVLGGPHPHLAWSTSAIVADHVFALAATLTTAGLSRALARRRRAIAQPTVHPAMRAGH